jgi:hypothetical protein
MLLFQAVYVYDRNVFTEVYGTFPIGRLILKAKFPELGTVNYSGVFFIPDFLGYFFLRSYILGGQTTHITINNIQFRRSES